MKKKIISLILVWAILTVFIVNVPVLAASEQSGSEQEKICLVLDPGHGGSDPGTSGSSSLGSESEKVYALKIAKYMKTILEENGNFNVYLTRDEDRTVSLAKRAEYADEVNADALISLHFNYSTSESVCGAEVWQSVLPQYRLSDLPNLFLQQLNSVAGLNISRGVKSRVSENKTYWNSIMNWDTAIVTGQLADYYDIIKYNAKRGIPAFIVEHAFLSNAGDLAIVNTEEGLQKIAKADANALIEFYTKHVHSYQASSTDYPVSCILAGKESEHCSVCGVRRNVKALADAPNASFHFYEEKVQKAATTAAAGMMLKTCQYDKSHQETVVIPKLVVTPGNNNKVPQSSGSGSNSTEVIIKVGKTTISKLKKKKKSVVVTCKKVSGAKGYQTQVALNRKMKKGKRAVLSSKCKVTIKKCVKKKYYVRARAFKIGPDKKKVYGSWSKIKIAKCK